MIHVPIILGILYTHQLYSCSIRILLLNKVFQTAMFKNLKRFQNKRLVFNNNY